MDFDLSDEQRLLKESVDRLIADQYQFEQRKQYMAEPAGCSAAVWNRFAELGLLGLPFAETLGGFGGGAVETMIVMEAFGRGLVLEPYFATVILGGGLLRRAGSEALRAALVPQITAGKLKLAFAHVERHSRYDLATVTTTARKDGDDYVLNGAKSVVLHGDCADKLLVTARISGAGAIATASACSWSMRMRRRDPARLPDAGRPARGGNHAHRRARRRRCGARATTPCRRSSTRSTRRSPRYAPKRSARCRRCTT